MTSPRARLPNLVVVLAPVAAALLAAATQAGAAGEDQAERNERCATRLSIALLGQAAEPAFLVAGAPQDAVDRMLASEPFIERFARFTNTTMNSGPGEEPGDDAVYHLTKRILEAQRPWSDLFVGKYTVEVDATTKAANVVGDVNGLGYFRSPSWLRRYAGNEPAGYKLNTAYRILNNTLGLELVASTNIPGEDRTSLGRQGPACAGCHYSSWYALDTVAKVLTRRVGTGTTMTFTAPSEGPQTVLGGKVVANDGELVHTLVDSEAFRFRTCRMAFEFLYGRGENECEAPLFDACVAELTTRGTIQSALAVVAKDPGFCQ